MIQLHRHGKRRLASVVLALGVCATALLGASTAGAAPSSPSSAAAGPLTVAVTVQPFGTKAIATVTTSQPAAIKASAQAASVALTTAFGRAIYATTQADTLANLPPTPAMI